MGHGLFWYYYNFCMIHVFAGTEFLPAGRLHKAQYDSQHQLPRGWKDIIGSTFTQKFPPIK